MASNETASCCRIVKFLGHSRLAEIDLTNSITHTNIDSTTTVRTEWLTDALAVSLIFFVYNMS